MLHFKRQHLDAAKWDACIDTSANGKPYMYSWWLDIVCPNWEYLATADYSAIFPLTIKRKLGFKALIHPPFVQRLSCISADSEFKNNELFCVKYLEDNFRIFDIQVQETMASHFTVQSKRERTNYFWEYPASSYTTNHKRNLKKAQGFNGQLNFNTPPKDFIAFFEKTTALIDKTFGKKSLKMLSALVEVSLSNKHGIICSVYQGDELVDSAFMVKSGHYICYCAGGSNPKGKNSSAMYLIMDAMIGICQKENLKLDFEGSDLSGVAKFFEGFGAKKESYYRITKMPLVLK